MPRFEFGAIVSSVLMVTLLAPARAQSLADVARKEEERRKSVPAGKVYTNKDLKGQPPRPAAAAAAADKPADASTPDKPQAAEAREGDKSAGAPAKDPPKGGAKEKDAPRD